MKIASLKVKHMATLVQHLQIVFSFCRGEYCLASLVPNSLNYNMVFLSDRVN